MPTRHRPMALTWLRSVVAQCQATGIPVWVKQDSARQDAQQGRIPDAIWTRLGRLVVTL